MWVTGELWYYLLPVLPTLATLQIINFLIDLWHILQQDRLGRVLERS